VNVLAACVVQLVTISPSSEGGMAAGAEVMRMSLAGPVPLSDGELRKSKRIVPAIVPGTVPITLSNENVYSGTSVTTVSKGRSSLGPLPALCGKPERPQQSGPPEGGPLQLRQRRQDSVEKARFSATDAHSRSSFHLYPVEDHGCRERNLHITAGIRQCRA